MKIQKYRILLVLILIIVGSFAGCDYTQYPYTRNDHWLCLDPHFELKCTKFDKPQNGVILDISTTLYWNNETMPVEVDYRGHSFEVYATEPAAENGAIPFDTVLFSGTWEYEGKNLVFYIEEDYLFDGQYTKLIFESQ